MEAQSVSDGMSRLHLDQSSMSSSTPQTLSSPSSLMGTMKPARVHIYFLRGGSHAVLFTTRATESSLRRFTSTGRAALPSNFQLEQRGLTSPAASNNEIKYLYLDYPCKRLPTPQAFDRIQAWMNVNRTIQMPAPVIPLVPPFPDQTSLALMIDTYAAALAVGLMPKPRALRHLILDRVTRTPLQAAEMEFAWHSLSADDGIIMRIVRAYYHHDRQGAYDYEQKLAIYGLTDREPQLDRLFLGVEMEMEQRMPQVGPQVGIAVLWSETEMMVGGGGGPEWT